MVDKAIHETRRTGRRQVILGLFSPAGHSMTGNLSIFHWNRTGIWDVSAWILRIRPKLHFTGKAVGPLNNSCLPSTVNFLDLSNHQVVVFKGKSVDFQLKPDSDMDRSNRSDVRLTGKSDDSLSHPDLTSKGKSSDTWDVPDSRLEGTSGYSRNQPDLSSMAKVLDPFNQSFFSWRVNPSIIHCKRIWLWSVSLWILSTCRNWVWRVNSVDLLFQPDFSIHGRILGPFEPAIIASEV